MIKLPTTLLLTLVLAVSASPQRKQTDLEKESLRGPVHLVVSESSESFSVGEIKEKGRVRKLDSLTYNPQGQLIERVIYDDYGFLVGQEKYSYEPTGDLAAAELFNPKGVRQEKRTYTYRSRGQLSELISYGRKGEPYLKQAYLYDTKGNLSAEVYYDPVKERGKTSFQMNEHGQQIEAAFFRENGEKAEATIGPCFSVHRVVYAYDGQDRIIGRTSFEVDGSVKRESSYAYDQKGNIAEEVRTDFWSTIKFVHSYEYDPRGNWTTHVINVHSKRKPLAGDSPDQSTRIITIVRKITYF